MPCFPAASLALAAPLYVAFVWAPSWPLALLFLVGPTFLNYFYLSSAVALVQQEVRPDQRVMSGALLLLVMNFIGLGLRAHLRGRRERLLPHQPSGALSADRPLYTPAVLRRGDNAVSLVGARAGTGASRFCRGGLMRSFHHAMVRHALVACLCS